MFKNNNGIQNLLLHYYEKHTSLQCVQEIRHLDVLNVQRALKTRPLFYKKYVWTLTNDMLKVSDLDYTESGASAITCLILENNLTVANLGNLVAIIEIYSFI